MRRNVRNLSALLFLVMLYLLAGNAYSLTEGFERGKLSSNWISLGQNKWFVVSDDRVQGRFSARVSSPKYGKTKSVLQTTTISRGPGFLTFYIKTEFHGFSNSIKLYVDGALKFKITRTRGWKRYSVILAKGNHTLRWEFDDSSNYSSGKVWLDNIKAPLEDFTVHNRVSYDKNCSVTYNDIWVGDFKGSIPNLAAGNFNVYVNNRKVTWFRFTRTLPRPTGTSLVMDYSGSMGDTAKRNAESAASEYVRLMSIKDRAEVIKFGSLVKRVQRFTGSRGALYDAISRKEHTGGTTALYDATMTGLINLRNAAIQKKALIVYTDGQNNASRYSIEQVINYASTYSIPIYTIGLGTSIDESSLRQIATSTGGLYFRAPTSKDLVNIYTTIKGSLAGLYRITLADKAATSSSANINIRVFYAGKMSSIITRGKGCRMPITPMISLLLLDNNETTLLNTNDSVTSGAWKYYTVTTDPSQHGLKISITNLSSDVDLYVKKSAQPNSTSYDCRPYKSGTTSEICVMPTSGASTWHIGVYGYSNGSYTLNAVALE